MRSFLIFFMAIAMVASASVCLAQEPPNNPPTHANVSYGPHARNVPILFGSGVAGLAGSFCLRLAEVALELFERGPAAQVVA